MPTKKYVRTPGRSAAVLKVLQANRGKEMHINDIADVTMLPTTAITGAISHLRKTVEISSPRKGWYRYNGSMNHQVRVDSKAQVISLLADDRLLLEIEGRLYLAYELEVDVH